MGRFKIIEAGALTSIQDRGRWGHQHMGMPVSGAMDTGSLKRANWLVGNNNSEACIECTFAGPKIQFESNCQIAVTGATVQTFVNNHSEEQNKTLNVKAGDILHFGLAEKGLRFYISISGGIDVPKVMGSKSTYLRGKIGGFQGRKLEVGDVINFSETNTQIKQREINPNDLQEYKPLQTIRILPGTEVSQFSAEGIKTFLTETYTISPLSDRMGYRLSGKPIKHLDNADILSSGIPIGSVQIPGDGQPIIMMADRQTIGGYTKIAHVISADMDLLAQMRPGEKIRFKEIKLEEAQKLPRY